MGGASPRRWLGQFVRSASFLLRAAGVIYCTREFLVDCILCDGASMEPTFSAEGNLVLVEQVSRWRERIQVGDVVLARNMRDPAGKKVCKRVLGLGGDTVHVPRSTELGLDWEAVVPPGHVWLQGDNLKSSTDSRAYGPVPYALLRGRVFYKVWPLKEAGPVERQLPAVGAAAQWRQQRDQRR